MIAPVRILVLAPHPDDEVIGCGAALKQFVDAGATVKVVVVTDGAAGVAVGTDVAARETESLAGLRCLGIRDAEFWRYPDGNLPFGGAIAQRYRDLLGQCRPDHVFLPHPSEAHPDHRSLTRGFLRAAEGQWRGKLWFYETTQPCHPVNHFEDVSQFIAAKMEAIACHATQTAKFDYRKHCELLAGMRGLSGGVDAAEAFLAFDWDGSRQQFFVSEPLVSIVIRAQSPALVRHALASLKLQSYPWIEVVLVWFGAAPPPSLDELSVPVVFAVGSRNRSANLNLGVASAGGDLIGFLDEDDIFHIEHIAGLVAELLARPEIDIAFSGTRVIHCVSAGDAVSVVAEVDSFDHDYEPGRLLLGNYITLHSALLRGSVARSLAFDTALEAYEDWDFFAQAEQRGFSFARVDGRTCEYRIYPEEGAEASLAAEHLRKGHSAWREVVRQRICKRMSTADLDRIGNYADRNKAPLASARAEVGTLAAELARLRSEVEDYGAAATWIRSAMESDATLPVIVDGAVRHLVGRGMDGPVVSILMPVFNTDPRLLAITLQSILDQTYPRWELCLVDDASTREETRQILDQFEFRCRSDARVAIRRRAGNGGIVAASNDALEFAHGRFVAFVDHDDVLAPDALLHVAMGIMRTPEARLLYTDNRTIDHTGKVLNAFAKPDWSPSTLLSYNYVNHLMVVRADLLRELGGLRENYAGAQDWDLLLRLRRRLVDTQVVHLPAALYDWRATGTSLAYSAEAKPWAVEAAKRALADAVAPEVGSEVTIERSLHGQGYRVAWSLSRSALTVVIPTLRNADGLRRCVRGLFDETDHGDLSLLVIASRCDDADIRAALEEVASRRGVTIVDDQSEFSWPAMVNRAVVHAGSGALLLLNDDIEVIERGWLQHMQRYLDLAEIGAVGASIFFPDGGLRHGGMQTDPTWIAQEVRAHAPQEGASIRDVSAVSGACLLTTCEAVRQAGGFDEALPSHYADVDYCLALRQLGFRVVQSSEARLSCHAGATGEPAHEGEDPLLNTAADRMRRKWGAFLQERYRVTYQLAATTRILEAGT